MISVIRTTYPSVVIPESKQEIMSLYHSCFSNKRVILLIENAGKPKQIKRLAPLYATCCLIIVTSRKDLSLDVDMEALSIRLGALKPEHATHLLQSIVPRLTDDQASEIAKLCG